MAAASVSQPAAGQRAARHPASAPRPSSRAARASHAWTFRQRASQAWTFRWGLRRFLLAGVVAGLGSAFAASPAAAAAPSTTVIVRVAPGALGEVEHAVQALGGHVVSRLGLIHSVTADLPAGALPVLAADHGVLAVTPDAAVRLDIAPGTGYSPDTDTMFNVNEVIGAHRMWRAGYTGQGVDVALLDSGVVPVYGLNDPGKLVYGPDLTPESQNPDTRGLDTFGHGTHLAGIIAGHDPVVSDVAHAFNDTTDFLGVAPDARIVSVKVADYHGDTDVSQVIAGIDWVVQHAHSNGLDIRVLNLSFGTDSNQPYVLDPLAYAAEQAWRHGIVVVVAAGNTGTSLGHLTDPATDPFVIAVGAADPHGTSNPIGDTIPAFSAQGDGVRNPDLVAPGMHVQSLRVPGSYIDTEYGLHNVLDHRYIRGSGTSQAAAVVSGAVALVLSEYPSLTPDQVKHLLVSEAVPISGVPVQVQGAGMLSLDPHGAPGGWAWQYFTPSVGTGTLEGSRGSFHLVLNGVALTGEQDIFGQPVDTAALARQEATATAWTGGTFNGVAWTGSGWGTSLGTGQLAWSPVTWTANSWASSAWASSAWADGTWTSSAWANATWQSSAWASSCWSSSAWGSSAWSTAGWETAATP